MPLSDRRRKEIASLGVKKYRQATGQFLVEGIRSVEAAISGSADLVEIFLSEAKKSAPAVNQALRNAHAPIHIVPEKDLARMADVEATQGILAVARVMTTPLEALLHERSILVLDGLQDPGNVGTILRSAAWFGVDAVVAGPGTADFFNPKVVRSAMGGLWDVRLAESTDLGNLLYTLRSRGYSIVAADMHGKPVQDWEPRHPGVLVMGSEAHGISEEVASVVDERVTIEGHPRRRGTESLNVGVAAGILLNRWMTASS